jgi:hypothetical protein
VGGQSSKDVDLKDLLGEARLREEQNMKKTYETPAVKYLGSVQNLTLTNQSDPYSDVPRGEISNNGDNLPS